MVARAAQIRNVDLIQFCPADRDQRFYTATVMGSNVIFKK
jgi:hypothetical protein